MIMKDGRLSIKRGYSLPINVTPNITLKDLLEKAVAKHTHFHKDVVQSNKKAFYQLLYADKSKVSTLPGSDEPFTLKSYKEEIDKPYSRIRFYLCSSSDYFDSVLHDFDLASDSDEPSEKTPEFPPILSNSNGSNNSVENQAQTNFAQSSTTSPSPNQEQCEHRMARSVVQEQLDLFEKDLQCPVFESKPVTALTTEASVQNKEEEQERLMSCPIWFSLHPVEQIEEHADNCSMWLLDDTNNECDIPDPSPTLSCNADLATGQVLTGYKQKKSLGNKFQPCPRSCYQQM